ncbi:hypothetical protein WAB97_011655 [Stenotrophomonas maltophilia]|uniref:hypothetical protein n=1 Tax=Stenotrophomonas maltophilia TaxID=40324 RepID=UPI00331C6808
MTQGLVEKLSLGTQPAARVVFVPGERPREFDLGRPLKICLDVFLKKLPSDIIVTIEIVSRIAHAVTTIVRIKV